MSATRTSNPETAHQVELGLDVDAGGFHLSPRLFYREVDDYIQGVPATDPAVIAVSGNANGDPDTPGASPTPRPASGVRTWISACSSLLAGGWTAAPPWCGPSAGISTTTCSASHRIHCGSSLSYQRAPVKVQLEQVLVDEQDRISVTNTLDSANGNNSFASTSGYG
ncbi:MAG: TonB-dependent receptor, partial [Halioglobus sp.]|nr:TonB-dependent receptor [Halioglobus sp.]